MTDNSGLQAEIAGVVREFSNETLAHNLEVAADDQPTAKRAVELREAARRLRLLSEVTIHLPDLGREP